MKKPAILAVIAVSLAFAAQSGPVTVTGKVSGAYGTVIRLMKYSDHVTYLKVTLDRDTVAPDGSFSLAAEIPETCYAWLDIEFQQAEIFLQPGGSYTVEIDYERQVISASYYDRLGLPMKITGDDDDRLNYYIQDFNRLYNDYLLGLTDLNSSRGKSASFETFKKAIHLRFQNASNFYLNDYIRYKTASMQLFLRIKGRDNLGAEYFTGQPVLYENVEYMDFFHLFFEKYFLAGNRYFSFNKTYDLFNGNEPYAVIIDSMGGDPAIENMELREILLLKGLKDLYYVSGFKKDRIVQLVTEVSENSEFDRVRNIARNLLVRLNWLRPGTSAPALALLDIETGSQHNLKDFIGRYVYLAFLESRNPACQAELQLSMDLVDRYSEKVNFVAVFLDNDPAQLRAYLLDEKIPWKSFRHDGNPEELEKFDATTFPHFLLIDEKGKVLRCPAPSPSEDIKKVFDSL